MFDNFARLNFPNEPLLDIDVKSKIEEIEKRNYSSKYKGVSYRKKGRKWVAQTRLSGKQKTIGYFKNEYDAHLAYEKYIEENKKGSTKYADPRNKID